MILQQVMMKLSKTEEGMIVYVVEGGDYEEKCIIGIYLTEEKAEEKKKEWNDKNAYNGGVIPNRHGGDGIKCYIINDARITEYKVE